MKARVTHRILLGYNGSASATQALLFANRLAGLLHAQLHVLAVAQPPAIPGDVELRSTIQQTRRQCRQALRGARLKLSGPARFRILVGHPARQVLRYAVANRIDQIVIGHHPRVVLGYATMSSVARQIAALAACPVTVVPNVTSARATGRQIAARAGQTPNTYATDT
jgi:nucleotide-binding universal stress UspA family protein